jgi:DNA topoisomerase IB
LFDYVAKEGVRQVHLVHDPPCVEVVSALKRRRGGGAHLLALRERGAWHQVHAHLINERLKALIGDSFSAKNFRTWNGTLLAAVSVATDGGEVLELLTPSPAIRRNRSGIEKRRSARSPRVASRSSNELDQSQRADLTRDLQE